MTDARDVSVPTTPTNPDLREQVANALAGSNLREVGDDGTLVRPFAAKSPMAFAYADAALSVVAPVLEGLRAELDAMSLTARQAFRALERRDKEITNLRADRDKEHESRIAWALEADRLQQERDALSSLLRGMARRVGQKREEIRELAGHLPCGWCNGTGIAPEERFGHDGDGAPMVDGDQPCPEGCRPPTSDQTPATPDDDAARHMADVTRHPRFAELYAQAAHNVRARDNHDQGDDTAPSSVQGDTTPEEA